MMTAGSGGGVASSLSFSVPHKNNNKTQTVTNMRDYIINPMTNPTSPNIIPIPITSPTTATRLVPSVATGGALVVVGVVVGDVDVSLPDIGKVNVTGGVTRLQNC